MEKTFHEYVLRTGTDSWLGTIVLDPIGVVYAHTDRGNFNIAFAKPGEKDFREFIAGLDMQYFAGKVFQSICYVSSNQSTREACNRFAEKILPALQEAIKQELNATPEANRGE